MVLVTGGTGFLGSILIRQLIDSGVAVRAIKRPSSRVPTPLDSHPRLQWVNADINDFFALEEAFEGVTEVYHCAALISFHPADRSQLHKVNVEGTAHVVTLALDHGIRLLHVSSVAALGRSKAGVAITEEDLWEYSHHESGYAVAKYESEQEVWRGIAEGLDAVIVNPALIIGASASDAGNGSTGTLFAKLRKGMDFYVTGSVGLIDVQDAAKAMILLMNNKAISGERFVLSNVNMPTRELLEKCSNYLGRKAPRFRATPFMLSVASRVTQGYGWLTGKRTALTRELARSASSSGQYSNEKVRQVIGMDFRPIEDTLREICTTLSTNTNRK